MPTYILARDDTGERYQTVLYNAADMAYIEVFCSEIGGTHVLRARFNSQNSGMTRSIHQLTHDDPLHRLGSLVLPYLRQCVVHAVSLGVPLIDEVFLGICLERYRQDTAALVMAREIVAEFAHHQLQDQRPGMVELSRHGWTDWREIHAFQVVDGAELQERMRIQMATMARTANRPPPDWVNATVVPHWYVTASGSSATAEHGVDTWKLGHDITDENTAGQWVRWWVDRRGLHTSWLDWWTAYDRIVGNRVVQRTDDYNVRAATANPEALRHLDLGTEHVGADVGGAVVQPGPVADDRSPATVSHTSFSNVILGLDAANARLRAALESHERIDPHGYDTSDSSLGDH